MNPVDATKLAEHEYEAAAGHITVSTLQFKPITAKNANSGLKFGDLKDIKAIAAMVDAANMGVSQLSYEALQLSMALSLAGPKISASDSVGADSGLSAGGNLGALLSALAAGEAPPEDAFKLESNLDLNRSMSYERTFDSPEIPDAPAAPKAPEGVAAAMVKLLERSATQYNLDPQKRLSLIAAYKMYMDALEEYYDPTSLTQGLVVGDSTKNGKGDAKDSYQPYRLEFSISVEPGWFTKLEQYEAVIDLDLKGSINPHLEELIVLNVVPAETAQTLDDMTSALQQIAMAGKLSGGMSVAAFQGTAEKLMMDAQRLQGFRKNNTMVVGYPAPGMIRVRLRPSIVATNHLADMPHGNHVFAATVLVSKADEKTDTQLEQMAQQKAEVEILGPKGPERFYSMEGGASAQSESARIDVRKQEVKEELKRDIGLLLKGWEVPYAAYFEHQAELRRKGRFNQNIFYHSPEKHLRSAHGPARIYVATEAAKAVMRPYPGKEAKKFGFTSDVIGFYDKQSDGKITAYLMFELANPKKDQVTFASPGGAIPSPQYVTGQSIVEALQISNVPGPTKESAPVRVILKATRGAAPDQETVIHEVTIGPRTATPPAAAKPSITIDRSGVKLGPTDLSNVDIELLKVLLGHQLWIAKPAE